MLRAPLIVIDGFLPAALALQMRRDIDEHFANPHLHRPETHQVWNYWFVPELYTYLRANPEKVIGHERVTAFHGALCDWSSATLGMANVTWPHLSLYVGGFRPGRPQELPQRRVGVRFFLSPRLSPPPPRATPVGPGGEPPRAQLELP